MKIAQSPIVATPTTPQTAPKPAQPAPTPDTFDPAPTHLMEKHSYAQVFKTAAQGAALVGIPALAGAATSGALGKAGGVGVSLLAGPVIGAAVGGVAGYKLTPGKEAGGIMLCMLTVPLGATIGAFGWPILSTIGAAGGLTGAAIGAGAAAVVLGGAEAVFTHQYNQKAEKNNQLYQQTHPQQ